MRTNFNKFIDGRKRSNDEYYMTLALEQATLSKSMGESARGAVLVFPNRIVTRETSVLSDHKPFSIAEINAINQARYRYKKTVSFKEAILYSTTEPSVLAFIAAYEYGIREYVWGCDDVDNGFVSSLKLDVSRYDIAVSAGILSEQCYNICTMHMREHLRTKENNNETPSIGNS
jgi:tRNA(adenine34) deaminase